MADLLDGKVGLVTGAGSGIGRATSLAAAQEGSKVVVADIASDSGNETVAMIKAAGGDASFIETDVSDDQAVQRMIAFALEHYGQLDWACNNAAAAQFGAFVESTNEQWYSTIAVTLSGVYYCMREQAKVMLSAGGGSIVNISSSTGVTGTALEAVYAAAKGGVEALSKSVAAEYAQYGLRVNSIAPGPIRTPAVDAMFANNEELTNKVLGIISARRLGEPEEVAQLVVWLASDRCNYLNGESILIDGAAGANSVFNN